MRSSRRVSSDGSPGEPDRENRLVPVKAVLIGGTAVFLAFLCSAALAVNPWMLVAAFFGTGFFMSLVDVSMNVLGIEIERRFDKPALGILHAGYSCGEFAGSLIGSLFAGLGIGAGLNFLVPTLVILGLVALAAPGIQPIAPQARRRADARRGLSSVPLLLVVCGLLAFAAYVSEGVCGDWGSLFLMKVKGAPEAAAALVYGGVAVSALVSRLGAFRRLPAPSRLLHGLDHGHRDRRLLARLAGDPRRVRARRLRARAGRSAPLQPLGADSGRLLERRLVLRLGLRVRGAPLLPAALRVARRALRHRRDL